MNAMESKICERCGDYFSRKIGSKIEECLDCKNERESDKVEKLPTKKKVMERRLKGCDVINNGIQIGHSIKHRPEPNPPEKNALIIYVDKIKGNMELMYGFSSGVFVNGPYSPLCITRKYNREPAFAKWDMTVSRWYCPSTDQKINWQDEWTPEEFRK